MFKVGLENYTVLGKHGAYDFEHEYEQPFVVSIWVELNHNQFDDDLSKTINYADLQNLVYEVIVNMQQRGVPEAPSAGAEREAAGRGPGCARSLPLCD